MKSCSSLYDHIVENIIELDKDEIKILSQPRYNTITKRLNLPSLVKELACKYLNIGMYKTLRDWVFYVHVYELTDEDLTKLDSTLFDDMDMIDLERKYLHMIIPETVMVISTSSNPLTLPSPLLHHPHRIRDRSLTPYPQNQKTSTQSASLSTATFVSVINMIYPSSTEISINNVEIIIYM